MTSSQQDPGTKHASIEKAQTGAVLLSAGDYEGAIAICTEAIELEPRSLGAYRTRAEAYKCLGREAKAQADLNKILMLKSGLTIRTNGDEEGDPRPALCERLRRIGVEARPAGRKERAPSGGDAWLIDVAEGPIRQVTISNHVDREMYGGGDYYVRQIDYLVPDLRIGPHFSRRGVNAVGMPSEELVGVVLWIPVVSPLRRYDLVTPEIDGTGGLIIRADPERRCWVFTQSHWRERETDSWIILDAREPSLADAVAQRAPSRQEWKRYQVIASRLLAAPALVAASMDRTEEVCAALRNLGVNANVVEQDASTEGPEVRWVQLGADTSVLEEDLFTKERRVKSVQIADGPIRWVELGLGTLKGADKGMIKPQESFLSATGAGLGFGTLCYVPDARIARDSPQFQMVSVRLRSFPLVGRVKGVRWEYADLGVPSEARNARDFNLRLSERLGQDPKVTAAMKSSDTELCVGIDPDRSCWILAADDRPIARWTERLWGSCQTVADRLLAMPMPTVE